MKRTGITALFLLVFLLIALLPSAAFSQVAGKLTKVDGGVDILKAGTAAAVPAQVSDSLSIGDILRTKSDGRAVITFVDNSVVTVGPKSRLGIEEYLFKPEEDKRVVSMKLHRGKMEFDVPKPVYSAQGSKFEMKTRTAVAGIRGTAGATVNLPRVERLYITSGLGELTNRFGTVRVSPGMVGESYDGGAPRARTFSPGEFNSMRSGGTTGGSRTSGGSGTGGGVSGSGAGAGGDLSGIPGGAGGGLGSVTNMQGTGSIINNNANPNSQLGAGNRLDTTTPANTPVNVNVQFPNP